MSDAPTIEMVAKEDARGDVGGSYYGSRVRIMARSPTHVIFNGLGGHIWRRAGGESSSWHDETRLFSERPTIAKFEAAKDKIDAVFGPGVGDAVVLAWRTHKTVLVDGGGEPMRLPNLVIAKGIRGAYASVTVDWNADLTGLVRTCKQCGTPLRPDTDHHHMDSVPMERHPRTVEECQRMTNHPVIAVHGYGSSREDMYGLINWFESWDGESYHDPDFCNDKCAAAYGRRAAHERELLEPGIEPPKKEYRRREDKHHYDREAAEARRSAEIAATFAAIRARSEAKKA